MAIPNELIDDILCLLPVKHLLRCRCVSKWWCSLIDSTAFVKKHLKKSMECNADGVIINGCGKFYLTDVESLDDENAAVVEIDHEPLKTFVSGAQFVGSVNGLVCLSKDDINETLLFNPSTRKYMMVPSAPAEFPRSFNKLIGSFFCGFGYDEVNDDYKVVKIAECYFQCNGKKVIVYSLRNNLWTWVNKDAVPVHIAFTGKCGMFVGGALHWLTINPENCTEIIVRFDLWLEQFKELPFPPVDDSGRNFVKFDIKNVIHVGESLCIRDDYSKSRLDIWLMKNNCEMGNPWYKAFSVERSGPLGSFRSLRPIAFSKSGKDVLVEVDGTRLVWYDLEKKAVVDVRIQGLPVRFDLHLYTESLLQLPSNRQPQKISPDKHGKKRDEFLSKGFKLRL